MEPLRQVFAIRAKLVKLTCQGPHVRLARKLTSVLRNDVLRRLNDRVEERALLEQNVRRARKAMSVEPVSLLVQHIESILGRQNSTTFPPIGVADDSTKKISDARLWRFFTSDHERGIVMVFVSG